MIFQQSSAALNPKKKILDIVGEPLKNFDHLKGNKLKKAVLKLLQNGGAGSRRNR